MQAATSPFNHRGLSALLILLSAAVGLHFVMGVACCCAQTKETGREDERAQRARQMEQRAQGIKVYQVKEGNKVEVPRHERPLLRFSDPARELFDGTLWAWGTSGRPVAIVTLERYQPLWTYELISLAIDGVAADLPDGRRWAPRKPGLEWQAFPDAPAPAEGEAQRLRQVKALAERFSGFETIGTGNFELRRMPTPIHRYSSRDGGTLDGALFLLVYGTNPEVLIVLECQGNEKPAWKYSLSRLTTAPVSVGLDGREVWTRPHIASLLGLDEPYMGFAQEAGQVK